MSEVDQVRALRGKLRPLTQSTILNTHVCTSWFCNDRDEYCSAFRNVLRQKKGTSRVACLLCITLPDTRALRFAALERKVKEAQLQVKTTNEVNFELERRVG